MPAMGRPDDARFLVANRRIAATVLFLVGTLGSLAVAHFAARADQARNEARRIAEAESHARMMQRLLATQLQEIQALSRFAALVRPMDRKTFGAIAGDHGPAVTGLSWVEMVLPERRGAFEEHLSRTHARAIRIHPLPSDDAPDPPYLMVLAYAEPRALEEAAAGLDLSVRPQRSRLIERAFRERRIVAKAGIPLLGEPDSRKALIIVAPLFDPFDPERPRAVIQMSLAPEDVAAAQAEIQGNARQIAIALDFDGGEGVEPVLALADPGQELARLEYPFAGGHMSLRAHAGVPSAASVAPIAPAYFAAGLAITALLTAYLHLTLSQRSRTERLVAQRTANLQVLYTTLADSAERSAFALQGTGDGIWDWDLTTNRVYYSPEWKRMLGYAEDEIDDDLEEWEQRVHPDDRDEAVASIEAHLRGETPFYESIHRIRCRDGQYRWMLDRGKAVSRTPGGLPTRLVGTYTDIDQTWRLQEEARRLNAYLKAVLDAATEVAIVTTDSTGTIQIFNRGAENLLGYASEELVGRETPMLFHDPEEVARRGRELSQRLGRPVEGFDVFAAPLQDGEQARLWRYIRKDGGVRTVRLMTATIQGQHQQPLGFMGIAVDMTRQLEDQAAVKRSSDLLRALSDRVPGFLYQLRMSPEGHASFPFASSGIEQVIELTPEDVETTADPAFERIHPQDLAAVSESINFSAQQLVPWLHEFRVILPRRGLRWLRGEAQPERLDDGSVIWHGYFTDVSREKRLEEQLRDEARMDPLTGAYNRRHLQRQVSHELAMLEQTGKPLSLIMLDLDNFKVVNDTFGHDIGDEVLKLTTDTLRAQARTSDLVCRTGGEELVVLCPGTDLKGAVTLAEKLRQAVRNIHLPPVPRVTASFGVAAARAGDQLSTLMKRADDLVYAAKRAGKDRVMHWTDEMDGARSE